MSNNEFYDLVRQVVSDYSGEKIDNIYVVWMSKTLQNNKALLSSISPDDMYYELTYNGNTKELYLDAYKKWQNLLYNVQNEDVISNSRFVELAKDAVVSYFNDNSEITDKHPLTNDDVYVVWICKTLQNHKALLSTTVSDGMYYELTYNGDKNELYLDAYKKWHNEALNIDTTKPITSNI